MDEGWLACKRPCIRSQENRYQNHNLLPRTMPQIPGRLIFVRFRPAEIQSKCEDWPGLYSETLSQILLLLFLFLLLSPTLKIVVRLNEGRLMRPLVHSEGLRTGKAPSACGPVMREEGGIMGRTTTFKPTTGSGY